MKSTLILFICALFFMASFSLPAAPGKQMEMADRIDKLVKKYFPDAIVTRDNGKYSAKYGTRLFTIHPHLRTGEILMKTVKVEGPNFMGFMISISVREGKYEGPAVVPQTLNKRYWYTYFDRPLTKDGKSHFVIDFSYGSRTHRDFMKAIFEVITRPKKKEEN